MRKLKGLYILDTAASSLIYGDEERREIARLVDIEPVAPLSAADVLINPQTLADTDVLFSGWGGPVLDKNFLDAAPRLRAVFYGAGAMGCILTPAVWERDLVLTSAIAANAQPVAEYTLATILFSLKHGWRLAHQTRAQRRFPARDDAPGCYGSTVGLISLGVIARTLLKLLEPFDLKVLVYDPFVTDTVADELGVEKVSLEALFRRSDVVSVHTPLMDETRDMIRGGHVASMRTGATFINTARGAVVRETELIEVLKQRPDLHGVVDVTEPEPPEANSPLYTMENVTLTPHIAGSVANECRRMGRYMVEELERYLAGEPLRWAVTRESAANSSHRPAAPVAGPRQAIGA